MLNDKYSRTASRIINLTKETIMFYNDTNGRIIKISPSETQISPKPEESIYYIVDNNGYKAIKATGRSIKDLIIISGYDYGRNLIKMARLVLVISPMIHIRYAE